MVSNSQEEISAGITNFFQDLLHHGFDYAIKEIHPTSIDEFAQFFYDLSAYSKSSSSNTNLQQPIFDAVVDFFTQDNWEFQQLEPEPILQIHYQGQSGAWNCYAQARDTHQHFIFYSICPLKVPASKLQSIAEFIARANYDMVIGNFELDFDVGEVRYKTSIHLEDEELKFNVIKHLVYTNVNMMDTYLPGIISVINSDILPASAIQQIELNQNLSPSANIQSQEKITVKEPHILAKLTPNEIGEFHQALQMMQPYQRKQTQAMIDKLQKSIIARLGDFGLDIFDQAVNFFIKNKFPGKNLKLIQRYSGIAGRTKSLIQQLPDEIKQHGELADNSDVNPDINDLETLFWQANQALEALPTDKLLGEKELKYLIEIEQLREELAVHQRFVRNLAASPDKGLS
jgi:hypothetical protein